MKQFAFISLLIIFGGLSILIFVLTPYQQPGCGVKDFEPFCGTNAFYDEAATEGKRIFNTNCAACHKLDRDMTGPALRNMGRVHDTLTLINFLREDKSLIESKGNYNTCVLFPQLTAKDISNLIKYTDY